MNELRTEILEQLNKTTEIVLLAKKNDLADLIESHPDFPHCERYVVDLVNIVKKMITGANRSISKSDLLSIYQKYSGIEDANTLRTDEILSRIS